MTLETKNPSKLSNPSTVFAIENIKIRGHRRPLKESTVAALMDSIKDCGLVNPITVATKKDGAVLLVAGYHRLEACRRLGWKTIPAHTLHSSVDMLRELAEIDENLIRNELSPLEMADSLKRRKEIYVKLHPPTKRGGDHTSETGKQNAGSALCFAKDTAASTGKSERVIQQNVKIATDLTKAVKEKIKDTPIAGNKEELKTLASVPKQQQAKIVDKVLSGQSPSVRAAVEPKRLDPKKCFSPQPGEIPQTDDPPQPSLAEQQRLKALSPLSDDADMAERLKRDEELMQIHGVEIPLETLHPASEMINGGFVKRPQPYNIRPVQLTKEQAQAALSSVIRGYFTDKDRQGWERLRKTGELGDTDLEILYSLKDNALEQIEG